MSRSLEQPPAAILWDLDGVIVDSGEYHYAAYVAVLAQRGVKLDKKRYYASLFGRRNWDILRDVLGDLPDDELRAIAQQKEVKFRELARGHIAPLPGAKELLRRAHEAGLKQSIVSSTPRENIEMIVDSLGVRDDLDAIVGEEDSERGKPDPQPFTTAADRLAVPYEGCVVLEDAPEGIAAGKTAGMRTIGVTTTRPAERLSEADLVVASLEDGRVWQFISNDPFGGSGS
ncbi:MAG: HAD family phosphatase [Chloroflexota bacterium]|nr:HAD family phosphatase [Chloroflexota bacterium]